jgi:PhzF family phenazine biosynthesis protein
MHRFSQVDVFSNESLRGNPVAVAHDADDLDAEQMQRFTRWTNLSEATFLGAPTDPAADYAVRIFFPGGELPFAGHPTLGSCHAWLEAGGQPHQPGFVVQQCPAGLVTIRTDGERLAFAAPPLVRSGPVSERELERIARVLGIGRAAIVASQWVDNGPGWVAVMLDSAQAVMALAPVGDGESVDIGVVGPYADGGETAYEVRAFFSAADGRLIEDPVTGSLNASLAQWLVGSGRYAAPYVASQGLALGRHGRVYISQGSDGTIWVGGATHTVVSGRVDLA